LQQICDLLKEERIGRKQYSKAPLLMRLLTAIFLFGLSLQAQPIQAPLDIPLYLSGTFGELRSNHFHSGLDIKTEGVEGKIVSAVWSGTVSRIVVSPYGYGNALYIDHPNGLTSVYAHLQRFNTAIQSYVREQQYAKETYALDIPVATGKFRVNQGDIVALSGNSGGSGGPHLHFELRNTADQTPVNPLLHGIEIQDDIAPSIQSVRIVELNERYQLIGAQSASNAQTYKVGKTIGIEIEAFDRLNGASNKNGANKIELKRNGLPLFSFTINSFPFHETRYLNAHINYEEKACCKKTYSRMYLLPGNVLDFYKYGAEEGLIELDSGQTAELMLTVYDFEGNKQSMSFTVEGTGVPSLEEAPKQWLSHKHEHNITVGNAKLRIALGCFYKDEILDVEQLAGGSSTLGARYKILNSQIPAQKNFNLTLSLDSVPERLRSRTIVVRINENGGLVYEGKRIEKNTISASSRSFGVYGLAVDSIPPKLSLSHSGKDYDFSKTSYLRLKISDNLSGLDTYRCSIDGKWHLAEYDAKSNLFLIPLESIFPGTHSLAFEASDKAGNLATFSAEFRR
jgi:murein DD-endopeptidase MepM/ murein hydrolase activator NlpD